MSNNAPTFRVALGVTGASGAVYARKFAQTLLQQVPTGELHLVMTPDARKVAMAELNLTSCNVEDYLIGSDLSRVVVYDSTDMSAAVSSGSFRIDAVVVCPCSMNTLGAIASGCSPTLVSRMAGVALKEHIPLVLVPRETPLSLIHLRNMTSLVESGAVILPAMPAFYHQPGSVNALVEHLVMKILDVLRIPNCLPHRWSGED